MAKKERNIFDFDFSALRNANANPILPVPVKGVDLCVINKVKYSVNYFKISFLHVE